MEQKNIGYMNLIALEMHSVTMTVVVDDVDKFYWS